MTTRHWQQSYGEIPTEIDADRYPSMLEICEQAMTRYANKPAFTSFGKTLSYADIDRQSRNFAAYLQNHLGVKRGDRVAVMMPNFAAFPIVLLGILRVGAAQVNVNPMYTPRELQHQLNDAGAQTIVIFSGASATLAEVSSNTSVQNIISVNPGDGLDLQLPSPPVDARLSSVRSLSAALEIGSTQDLQTVELYGEDLIFLQYTGGTTGPSKGATLRHRNLVANCEQFKAFMNSSMDAGNEVMVTAIPMYHIFALTISLVYFSMGTHNYLVADPRDMDNFVEVLKAARPTVFPGVNTLYNGLVQHPRITEVDWSRLKLPVGGGAAVVSSTSQRWQEITGRFIREGYGLSETSPVVSFNPAYIEEFSGTTGLPMPSTDIKLLDDEDQIAAIGEAGEICVKGPQVMEGYWNKPEANAEAFTADAYFRTGDIGVFDERGFLKIVDRKKDMIIVSGFNVYPNEVEDVAAACPGVAECACVGLPDARSGEVVTLFVVPGTSTELQAQSVIDHCRSNLTGYKVPKDVRIVEALPKSNVGKVLRKDLRALA